MVRPGCFGESPNQATPEAGYGRREEGRGRASRCRSDSTGGGRGRRIVLWGMRVVGVGVSSGRVAHFEGRRQAVRGGQGLSIQVR